MLAPRVLTSPSPAAAPDAARYFDHRAATCRGIEMLVGIDLDLLWSNAAALALMSRRGPISLADNRLILSQRRQEDSLRSFLADLQDGADVWALEAEGGWLVRAEAITPADAPPAWLLTWQSMAQADRYLWADIGLHLRLTPSETRILRSLVDGSTVEQTANQLAVSIQTVRTHVRRIYAKLGVNNREQLFAMVLPYRWG
jgi:DNA-binding CsgD family transcriptional regulator